MNIEWEVFEGMSEAFIGDNSITIDAAMNKDKCSKWGETYVPGRSWGIHFADGKVVTGHSADLRTAKKETVALVLAFEEKKG